MTCLVDTNVVSEVMRKSPDPKVVDWFTSLDPISVSVVTLDELVFGLRRRSLARKEAWLRRMLADRADVLPVTAAAAHWSGERRSMLESSGPVSTQADALIAACAWEHGLILATRNPDDFRGFGVPLLNPFE